jgi:hypothetical protein
MQQRSAKIRDVDDTRTLDGGFERCDWAILWISDLGHTSLECVEGAYAEYKVYLPFHFIAV